MTSLLKMYVTLLPAIIAGVLNMIWCKTKICQILNKPIDGNQNFIDGKRILGNNKTWKGFLGYIVFNVIACVLCGELWNLLHCNNNNFFYDYHENKLLFNLCIGFWVGLFYALFELPNSFLKRRLDIEPGKPASGLKKGFFIILDQADSVFGVCLAVAFFHHMSIGFYLLYVLVGTLTHLIFNMLLYFLKLRKNMF